MKNEIHATLSRSLGKKTVCGLTMPGPSVNYVLNFPETWGGVNCKRCLSRRPKRTGKEGK